MALWIWSTAAFAWETSGRVLTEPVVFEVHDAELGGVDPVAEVDAALAAWTGRGCAPAFPGASRGAVIGDQEATFSLDGHDRIVFLPGATFDYLPVSSIVHPTATGVEIDIVFDSDFAFVSEAEAASPDCEDGWSLRGLLRRELGLIFGLAYSGVAGAAMVPVVAPCTTAFSALAPDDLDGFSAIYGPDVTVSCHAGRPGVFAGVTPLEITCSATTDDGTPVSARFEVDGREEPGPAAAFSLPEEGRSVVTGCATPAIAGCTETCATWEFVACDPPRAEFEVERTSDAFRSVRNRTELATEGCVSTVEWQLYAGEEEVWGSAAWEPTLPTDIEADRLTLTVSGPGGRSTVEEGLRGCGCATGSPGAGALGWLAGLLSLRARRSRSTRSGG